MFWQDLCIKFSYLATQRTEGESVEQAPVADLALAGVSQAFSWARLGLGLWSFIQENDSGTVDYVCLDAWYVQNLLNFWYPNHIMIRRSTYLFVCFITNQSKEETTWPRERRIVHRIFWCLFPPMMWPTIRTVWIKRRWTPHVSFAWPSKLSIPSSIFIIPPQNYYSHNVTRVMSGTHHPLEGISITWMVMACPTPNF